MLLVPMMVGGTALLVAGLGLTAARLRVPKQFRSLRASLRVSLTCVHGNHMHCDDHLHCPCSCHDTVIYSAIATRWEDALRPRAETNEM